MHLDKVNWICYCVNVLTKKQKWFRFIVSLILTQLHFNLFMGGMFLMDPNTTSYWITIPYSVIGLVTMALLWGWLASYNQVELFKKRES